MPSNTSNLLFSDQSNSEAIETKPPKALASWIEKGR